MSKNSKAHKRGASRNKRASLSRSRRGHRSHRNRRSYGGADALDGAPVSYHLAGSWPSRMSLGQGADYFKYHVGQHGGRRRRHRGGMGYDSNMGGAPMSAITNSTLPQNLRMAAHIDGIDKAINDVHGLRDPNQMGGPNDAPAVNHKGGRRRGSKRRGSKRRGSKRRGSKRRGSKRRGSKRRGGASKRRGSRRCWGSRNRRTRRRGGSMGYAPFPNQGMLLNSPREYAQAGLNPQWKTDVAFDLAKVRSTQ